MNRRRFLELLTQASVGATVAYSFPNVIVPKNIEINGFADAISRGTKFSGYTGEESWIEYCRGNVAYFDLIDSQLKNALHTIEGSFNFFGTPITFKEIMNSHV